MRVLHLTTEFPPVIYGGLGTAVGGLVHASGQAGIIAGVLLVGTTEYPGGETGYGRPVPLGRICDAAEAAPAVASSALPVAVFPAGWFEAEQIGVSVIRAWRPDVIHLHSFWLWPVARALKEQTGTPLVYTVHSLDRAEYEIGQGPPECLAQWLTQEAVICAADRVIALTANERDLVAAYCPPAGERIRIVGNGIEDLVPEEKPCPITGSCPAAGEAGPLVLYTGRFVERKGITDLLAAIPAVLARAPGTRFVLAGGHRHCSGADMARRWLPPDLEPLSAQITFTGWLTPPEMDAWYRRADVLVVPSWYEPFGMVILEGMLHGLPIAAADVGGPAEILEHGRTGLLFAPRCAEALAASLARLVTNPALRTALGTAAGQQVRRARLWPRIVEKMRTVYEEAASSVGSLRLSPPAHALAC